ncbi:MAG: Sensory box histidine kinase [Candidatus Daviesbacteria bacterium GW2011_GWA1_36_8]|uniref:histidine kinase n=1 Tax=Candidatus Daviesbacteria bacterium GW2011_GWA1_36_8 TaxID=1618417 RepID=A0A0G0IFH0_9BACT|nr:MAG: Sensory box histidine kinase [Candidatus Daviesbacteria bacterium GW2011_GWA1_36_8]
MHCSNSIYNTIQEDLTSAQSEIKLRDEFLSMASHELKTPLTSMLLQIQSALHNIKNVSLANFSVANLLKMLESVETQTERLSKMINDLLNVSLITTGKLELEKENFDLSKTVREVVNRFVEKLEKEGYTLSLEADKEILGNWDKLRIEQVITNLLTNAIKYGDKKPIEVRVINFNKSGKIHVKDQGIGIPAELQKKIFEKFERAVTSSQFQGSGLGLYITNQIVKAHNGKVHLKSREGKGSTFIVELPVAS